MQKENGTTAVNQLTKTIAYAIMKEKTREVLHANSVYG